MDKFVLLALISCVIIDSVWSQDIRRDDKVTHINPRLIQFGHTQSVAITQSVDIYTRKH